MNTKSTSRSEPVSSPACRRSAAVPDGADHAVTRSATPACAQMRRATCGVGRRQFDRDDLGRRRGPGDPQRAVAAVGAQFQCQIRIGPLDRGVEHAALLVADVDQERLLVGEPVDRRDRVVEIARPGVGQHVVGSGRLPAVPDLPGARDVPSTDGHPQERPPQQRDATLEIHGVSVWGRRVARGSPFPGNVNPLDFPGPHAPPPDRRAGMTDDAATSRNRL